MLNYPARKEVFIVRHYAGEVTVSHTDAAVTASQPREAAIASQSSAVVTASLLSVASAVVADVTKSLPLRKIISHRDPNSHHFVLPSF